MSKMGKPKKSLTTADVIAQQEKKIIQPWTNSPTPESLPHDAGIGPELARLLRIQIIEQAKRIGQSDA